MALELQLATPANADELADLDMAVFGEDGMGPSLMRQELTIGWGMLAMKDGSILGYALVRPGTLSDLTRLGIKDGYRGLGIGKTLLMAARKAHPGPMMLLVRKTNKTALELYAKTGFSIAGTKDTSWLMIAD